MDMKLPKDFDQEEYKELYLKALKKSGIEPLKTKTIKVTSLRDFTDAIIKAYEGGEEELPDVRNH